MILFDKRGTGMSDRDVGVATLEERMDDVRAVMDAAGSERAAVYGASRVVPWPRCSPLPTLNVQRLSSSTEPSLEQRPRLGGPGFPLRNGSSPLTTRRQLSRWPGHRDLCPERCRRSGDPGVVVDADTNVRQPRISPRSPTMVGELDVRSVLPTIQVPTLVLHRRGDLVVPIAAGEYIASQIPDAKFVALEGVDHVPFGDTRAWTGAIEEFLTGTRHEKVTDRVLATVVFTDVVASTDMAVRLGDADWSRLLDRHDLMARRTAERYSGRVVKTWGDGVLATFDGPARAARFASDFGGEAEGIGLPIRAGLHTGEVELRDDDIGGIAVHIAARIAALAGPGDVLASRTVKDLTTGSGLLFTDRGVHSLKGVPEEWQLYAVAY